MLLVQHEYLNAAFDSAPAPFTICRRTIFWRAVSSCPFCRHQNLPQTRSRCLAVSTPHPASRSTFVRPPVRPTSQSVYLSLRQTSPSAIHPIIQFDTTDPSTIKTEKKTELAQFCPVSVFACGWHLTSQNRPLDKFDDPRLAWFATTTTATARTATTTPSARSGTKKTRICLGFSSPEVFWLLTQIPPEVPHRLKPKTDTENRC